MEACEVGRARKGAASVRKGEPLQRKWHSGAWLAMQASRT